jgi:hypothetical protein
MIPNRAILYFLFTGLYFVSTFTNAQTKECTAHKESHQTSSTNTLIGVGCTEGEAKATIANALGKPASQDRSTQCSECKCKKDDETCTQSIDPKAWAKLSSMIQIKPVLTRNKAWIEKCHSTSYFKAILPPPNPPVDFDTECGCEGEPPKR